MPRFHRIALLVIAGAIAVVTFTMGASFSSAVDSAERAAGAWMFWAMLALVFAAPLWLPALVPARFVAASRVIRWCSALLVLVPTRYIASVLLHQSSLYGGGNFAPAIFGGALLLCAGCVFAIIVLALPDFRRSGADAA